MVKIKKNKTYNDIIEAVETFKRVTLMEIIEITPYDKERLLNFDKAIVESRICLKSNNLKTTYINMRKILILEITITAKKAPYFSSGDEFAKKNLKIS